MRFIFPKIIIEDKITEIAGRVWYPVDVAKINNQIVRLALFKGEYHWHKHNNEELFHVIERDYCADDPPQSDIKLKKGEMMVVPKGVEHCTKSSVDSYVLMFEPFSLESKGD
ncbi:MAG: mannose-6-phosphate isomerase [Candidatus Micrarchaeota archaeon]